MLRIMIGCAAAAMLTGCFSINARSDYYAGASFDAFERFAWIDQEPFLTPPNFEVPISPLNQRRIKDAVEAELEAKGYRLTTDRAAADFVVSLTMGTRERSTVSIYPPPYRGRLLWPGHVFGPAEVDTHAYTEGILSIDIFDESTKAPVWHGWATRRITDADLAKADERIRVAVREILAAFPPGA